MKKLFLLFAVVGMIFTACEAGGEFASPEIPMIEIVGGDDALSIDFSSGGTLSKSITFSSNYDWSVTSSAEWIKVTPESGTAGEECQITVSLEENNTYDARSGKITISTQEIYIDISVLQSQKNALILTDSNVKLPQAGGSFGVAVKSNIKYEYEIKADWIKVVESRALVESNIRFEAEANPTTDVRTGEILFKGEGLTETVVVTQSQTNVISLSSSTIEIGTNGGIFSVDVSPNVVYKVVIEEGCDWISQIKSRAVTTFTLDFAVSENKTGATRSATISVSGEDIKENITIKQNTLTYMHYTSSDSKIVTPSRTNVFGANIVSNTYENGQGVITFDGDVTQIGEHAFYGRTSLASIAIPDRVTSIGNDAFYKCTSLTSITIPDGVTEIGNDAFWNCSSLTGVTIPNSVTSIGGGAFRDCALTNVTIPDSVTEIGDGAFNGCALLTSATIPDSVNKIGTNPFGMCTSLTSFYGKFASSDNRCLVVDGVLNAFAVGNGVTEYTIIDSITSIGGGAFNGCTSLASLTIPNSVVSIEAFAFASCTSLASIAIPDRVTSIGGNAFYKCSSLTSVTIPNSVTSIKGRAFFDCSSLKEVYCKAAIPPTGGNSMFDYNASGRKIYVPTASVEAYKAAEDWSEYADYIEGKEF